MANDSVIFIPFMCVCFKHFFLFLISTPTNSANGLFLLIFKRFFPLDFLILGFWNNSDLRDHERISYKWFVFFFILSLSTEKIHIQLKVTNLFHIERELIIASIFFLSFSIFNTSYSDVKLCHLHLFFGYQICICTA